MTEPKYRLNEILTHIEQALVDIKNDKPLKPGIINILENEVQEAKNIVNTYPEMLQDVSDVKKHIQVLSQEVADLKRSSRLNAQ